MHDRLTLANLTARMLALAGGVVALAAPAAAPTTAPAWDTFSDTWAATDALGRALPMHEDVGPPRPDKSVGMFYFLWLGQHSTTGPHDISRILAAHPEAATEPDNPAWGPRHDYHHWGEPLFGYYLSDDAWVLRKHAAMLANAGVDTLVFDTTNNVTYEKCYTALGEAFTQVRRAGNATPQFAFLAPFDDPSPVVLPLFEKLYGPGRYADLWFRWNGKPLILADPALLRRGWGNEQQDTPAPLKAGHTLGQYFKAEMPFAEVGGRFPTWNTRGAAMTLALYRAAATEPVRGRGESLDEQRFENIADNAWLTLRLKEPLPAGEYYLEMSDPRGEIGWWSHGQDVFAAGRAYVDGQPAAGDRTLLLQPPGTPVAEAREFFTFRKPVPSYFTGPGGEDQWGWLEVAPQHAFKNAQGDVEQVCVGVAQNAAAGRLSAMSNPAAHGRSFHDGQRDPRSEAVNLGLNFAEQWQQAYQLDPTFVFVTGWNEWVAMRFDAWGQEAPGRPIFVDQFNQEFSRDIEPMQGGHGDNYYYQLIAAVRRFKGVRPLPKVAPHPITIDGTFDDWRDTTPEFRDAIGDAVHRDHPGWGTAGPYVNATGRADIVAAKVSYDDRCVYFYVRTQAALARATDPNWMLLFLDTDANAKTGWLGYDFVVNRRPGRGGKAGLERTQGGYRWGAEADVDCAIAGNQMEIALPRAALGLEKLPPAIDFKWADNLQQTGEASDFSLNGDAAPDDRFNYRAKFANPSELRP